jgi:WD40 repeat protein/tetratricopeptide (TPR) repeat protein
VGGRSQAHIDQRTLKGHTGPVYKVAFSNTGKELVSTGQDGTVRIWPLEQSLSAARRLNSSRVDPVFFADGLLIATAEGNHVNIWDAASGQRLRSLAEGGEILSIAISPDGRLLAVGNRPSSLSLWEIDSGRRLAEFAGMNDGWLEGHYAYCTVQTLAFSPDGRFLVAGFGSREAHFVNRTIDLKVWDAASRREVKRLLGHTNACVSICFSADGTKMASGSHDGTARVWDTATWQAAGGPLTAGDPASRHNSVEAVAFSPDGHTLAMGTLGGNILLGNLVTRERVALPRAHANSVHCVTFSPDGRTLASGSSDETVRLWNVATGRELMVLSSKDLKLGSVWSLSFSPDGTQLLAGGATAAVVWSAPPSGGDNPTWTAKKLEPLLRADAVFQERIRTLFESPRLRQALATLQVLHPDDRRVQAALAATQANWLAARQAWPEAVEAFERLRAADPTTPEVWLRTPGLVRLATALLQQNRSRDAAVLLAGHAKRRAQDNLADGARQEFDPLDAAINERLARQPRHPGLLELRAELAGQWSDAKAQVADYTAAIEALSQQPGKTTTADIQRLYGRRGIAYVSLEKWPEALADFAQVITKETTDVDLLSNRARAYEGLKNWDAAAADWSRAAAASPDGAKLLADFARRLAAAGQVPLANGHFAKAQALYERSLATHPENDLVATELAELLWNKHDHGNSAGIEYFWIDDAAPSGARLHGDMPWEWVSKPDHPVFRGEKATRRRAQGLSTHQFDGAAARLKIGYGAKLFAYVFLDPKDPPKTVMLQFKEGNNWEHRAFWGEDRMTEWGTQGKESRLAMGPLPRVGEWVRLEVDAARVGLRPGAELNGWAFTQYAGTCYWDAAGGTNCTPSFDSPWLALAAAYAVNGRKDEVVHYFGKALQRADGYEARKPILEFARQFDHVLSALVQQQPDDSQLQLALGRRFAKRGRQRLDDKQPAEALAELQKARAIFTRLRAEAQWKVLTPTELKSNGGEKFTVENDGSIFVSGPNPNRAVYTLKLRTDLPTLTAIRLETIPDARLPQGGAGRAGNGNFHLAEFTAAVESGQPDAIPTPIDFASAIADNWSGSGTQYTPARIIDNNPETFWNTDSNIPHWAVFGLKSAARIDGGSLSITLDSGITRFREHGLGRFRLSVTNQAEAVILAALRSDLKDSEVMDLSVALAKAHGQQGHIDGAVASFAEALDLAVDRAGKAKVITEAAPLAGVLEKLAERPVKDNAGRLAFAQLFYDRQKFASAARFWAEALASDPKLGDDRQAQDRYHAARAAALAAAGQGKDEPPLDDGAKANLRRQALDWLKAELTVWTRQLASDPSEARAAIEETLSRWQKDPDLAGIRDGAALAKFPAEEQKAFTQLWADVGALLKKAQDKPK